MLTLSLLRHAKSSWDDPSLDDFDRPLAKRGIEAAEAIGAWAAKAGLLPDTVLASSALRTRETLALILPRLGNPQPIVVYDDGLYLAAPADMLARIRKVRPPVRHLMLVGHNPGLHALALNLAGDGEKAAMADLARKLPTAALVVLGFAAEDWSKVARSSGHLDRFVTPRQLTGK